VKFFGANDSTHCALFFDASIPRRSVTSDLRRWLTTREHAGGLVAALSALKQGYVWIGWPGSDIAPEDQPLVRKQLWEQHHCVPVFLAAKLADVRRSPLLRSVSMRVAQALIAGIAPQAYYSGFSNGILWPLFHYMARCCCAGFVFASVLLDRC
jgi:trehalose-6-phosphate synthase